MTYSFQDKYKIDVKSTFRMKWLIITLFPRFLRIKVRS